jgi:hypothetical protein
VPRALIRMFVTLHSQSGSKLTDFPNDPDIRMVGVSPASNKSLSVATMPAMRRQRTRQRRERIARAISPKPTGAGSAETLRG